jgi:hypothetical protein
MIHCELMSVISTYPFQGIIGLIRILSHRVGNHALADVSP